MNYSCGRKFEDMHLPISRNGELFYKNHFNFDIIYLLNNRAFSRAYFMHRNQRRDKKRYREWFVPSGDNT